MPSRPHAPHHVGHVAGPSFAIAALSLALAAGLELLGVLGRVDASMAASVLRGHAESFPNALPPWVPWVAAVLFSMGLAAAVLSTPRLWRRMILTLVLALLIMTWVPVLALADYSPQIAAPWIATVWSGICAIFYAANHRMPCDDSSDPPP